MILNAYHMPNTSTILDIFQFNPPYRIWAIAILILISQMGKLKAKVVRSFFQSHVINDTTGFKPCSAWMQSPHCSPLFYVPVCTGIRSPVQTLFLRYRLGTCHFLPAKSTLHGPCLPRFYSLVILARVPSSWAPFQTSATHLWASLDIHELRRTIKLCSGFVCPQQLVGMKREKYFIVFFYIT